MGLYAAALEGPDFMGLPDKDREKGITRYLAPQFLPTMQAVSEGIFPNKGLLVLEEINRVPSDTTSVLYPLLLERKINGHILAPGWKIGVTMNPDTMNYSVNSLDDAMLDRFVAIEVTANLEDYIEYSLEILQMMTSWHFWKHVRTCCWWSKSQLTVQQFQRHQHQRLDKSTGTFK